MAEKQQHHAHEMATFVARANVRTLRIDQFLRSLGLLLGFLMGISTVVAGAVTAVRGAQLAGGFIGTGGVAMLVAVFVYGARREAQAETGSTESPEGP